MRLFGLGYSVLCLCLCTAVFGQSHAGAVHRGSWSSSARRTISAEDARKALIDSLNNPSLADGAGSLRFLETVVDGGRMNEDDAPKTFTFRWKNNGTESVAITRVTTTCGCAAPRFERKAVLPGKDGEINITYHPKGHPGKYSRKIFVYSSISSEKPSAVLELRGEVVPSAMPSSDYPVSMGELRLKRSEVVFDASGAGKEAGSVLDGVPSGGRQVERIECLNSGRKPLRLKAGIAPSCLSVSFEPESLGGGEIGDLVIRFDPSGMKSPLPERCPVILEGIDLAPSKRTIMIIFKKD